jgi:quinol monooxygenase YgiN
MIFLTVKFLIKPEYADNWPRIAASFTEATRAEPGCLWFDWFRNAENPDEYALLEAFRDAEAGAAHLGAAYYQRSQRDLPQYLAATPKVISQAVDQDDWSEVSELAVP